MSNRKKKIILWVAISAIVNIVGGALLTTFAHAGKFDGQYFVTFNGEIRHEGELVEEYQTDDNFTIKNGGLYYGLVADKNHRLGRVKPTGKNKATITISYWGLGRKIIKMHKLEDGTFKGKSHGWFTGEDGLRYTLKETVYAEIISQ